VAFFREEYYLPVKPGPTLEELHTLPHAVGRLLGLLGNIRVA